MQLILNEWLVLSLGDHVQSAIKFINILYAVFFKIVFLYSNVLYEIKGFAVFNADNFKHFNVCPK